MIVPTASEIRHPTIMLAQREVAMGHLCVHAKEPITSERRFIYYIHIFTKVKHLWYYFNNECCIYCCRYQ